MTSTVRDRRYPPLARAVIPALRLTSDSFRVACDVSLDQRTVPEHHDLTRHLGGIAYAALGSPRLDRSHHPRAEARDNVADRVRGVGVLRGGVDERAAAEPWPAHLLFEDSRDRLGV
ncbi:hypothetical protein [Demequina litorisediminis]|uniref:Uncharacterized protein n=1 Tax=Demequina litorisediminis TaxID=1849022 RepID=A0ABQ6I8U1_9MICO|nr:hypothetical protein [Demequina litorisediminis]GMA33891.1 hypothetical protein GCM10025876_00950 [Demequina litorisediminis]